MRSLSAQFAAFPVLGEDSSSNCDNLWSQRSDDYSVTFVTPLLLLSLFYSDTSSLILRVMQDSSMALWELVGMMQYKPLTPQHVCLLLLFNQLFFLYYCSLRIKPAVWPNLPDHKKTLEQLCKKPKNVCTLTVTFTQVWLLGTKLILMRDSKCRMNWDIFQKWLLRFTKDSPHLHRQMLMPELWIMQSNYKG